MSANKLLNAKVNINDLLGQYEKFFQKTKEKEKEILKNAEKHCKQQAHERNDTLFDKEFIAPPEENVEKFTETKDEPLQEEKSEFLPEAKENNAIVALNNKDNPQISIFDAYAFNEVMRRYENSIVQLTRQELKIKDYDSIKDTYEEKIEQIKKDHQSRESEIAELKEKEDNMREIIDQVNVIMDEKDERILEYETSLSKRDLELAKIQDELREKEEAITAMERQLYTVLFKISESNTMV